MCIWLIYLSKWASCFDLSVCRKLDITINCPSYFLHNFYSIEIAKSHKKYYFSVGISFTWPTNLLNFRLKPSKS